MNWRCLVDLVRWWFGAEQPDRIARMRKLMTAPDDGWPPLAKPLPAPPRSCQGCGVEGHAR